MMPDDVKRIRGKFNLTQQQFGDLTGLSKDCVRRYETDRTPLPPVVVKLLRVLDRHPEVVESMRE